MAYTKPTLINSKYWKVFFDDCPDDSHVYTVIIVDQAVPESNNFNGSNIFSVPAFLSKRPL
jgi:hypothetical protein